MGRLWVGLLLAAAVWGLAAAFVPAARQNLVFFGTSADRFCDYRFPRECAAAKKSAYRPETIRRHDACYPPLGYALVAALPRDRVRGGMLFAGLSLAVLTAAVFLSASGGIVDRAGWSVASAFLSQSLLALGVANQIVLAASGVCLFFAWNRREGWRRSLALLALALSAALKVSPALFALLLVRDRRWRDLAFFATAAGVLALMPFTWFGGWLGMADFLENLRLHAQEYVVMDAWGFIAVGRALALAAGSSLDVFRQVCGPFRLVNVMLGVVAVMLFFRNGKPAARWASDELLLALVVTLLPGCQQGYTALYFLPAMLALTVKRLTVAHLLFFALFCPVQVPIGNFTANHLIAAVAALALCFPRLEFRSIGQREGDRA